MSQVNSIGMQRLNDWFANYTNLISSGNVCAHNLNKFKNKTYLSLNIYDIDKLDEAIKFLNDNNVDLSDKHIVIESDEKSYITKEQCVKLIEIRRQLKNSGANIKVKDGALWELEDVLAANSHIDDVVKQVNNSTVNENGSVRPLNEMEKFLMIYSFVANRKYKENIQDIESSRHITSIFKNEDVVCFGFATLLKEICDRVGIKCYTNSCDVVEKDSGKSFGHANNIVIIDNKPYYCDACFDCIKSYGVRTFNYCLIPFEDSQNLRKLQITNCRGPFIYIEEDKSTIHKIIKEIASKDKLSYGDYVKYRDDSCIKKYIDLIPTNSKTSESNAFNVSKFGDFNKDYKEHMIKDLQAIIELINQKEQATAIPMQTFAKAITNMYKSTGISDEQANIKLNTVLEQNIERANREFNNTANNCFAKEYNKNMEL